MLKASDKLAGEIFDVIQAFADERADEDATIEEIRNEVSWAIEFVNVHQEDVVG